MVFPSGDQDTPKSANVTGIPGTVASKRSLAPSESEMWTSIWLRSGMPRI